MGRGGTSGIGVAAFEKGGLILDGGHAFGQGQVKESFVPSSASKAPPSPVIGRYDFPQNWKFVIAIPNVQRGLHGEDENRTFSDRCPITSEEVGKVCRLILVKALPSLLEGDIIGFGSALNNLQEAGFAGATKDLVHPLARSCVDFMRSKGAYGAGQSSFGPATFGLVNGKTEADRLETEVRGFLSANAGGIVFQSAANNHGALIKIIKG
jgi:beta-ribofuranosylaminobenzene 5'-phosphate synthase